MRGENSLRLVLGWHERPVPKFLLEWHHLCTSEECVMSMASLMDSENTGIQSKTTINLYTNTWTCRQWGRINIQTQVRMEKKQKAMVARAASEPWARGSSSGEVACHWLARKQKPTNHRKQARPRGRLRSITRKHFRGPLVVNVNTTARCSPVLACSQTESRKFPNISHKKVHWSPPLIITLIQISQLTNELLGFRAIMAPWMTWPQKTFLTTALRFKMFVANFITMQQFINTYRRKRDLAGRRVSGPWCCSWRESKSQARGKRRCQGNRPRPPWRRSCRRPRCCWRRRANARCRCWCSPRWRCSWTPRWRKPAGGDTFWVQTDEMTLLDRLTIFDSGINRKWVRLNCDADNLPASS